jgi:hypothetical protein
MVRKMRSICSKDEELKSIPICDLFYRIAMDIAGPLLKTKLGNKYILVAIDHSLNGARQRRLLIMVLRL